MSHPNNVRFFLEKNLNLIFKNKFEWLDNIKVEYFDDIDKKPAFVVVYNTTQTKISNLIKTTKKLNFNNELNRSGSISILQDDIDQYLDTQKINIENLENDIIQLQKVANLDMIFRYVISVSANA